jgi:nitrite reductase/ring-hydroxylating ferredoxin subunit
MKRIPLPPFPNGWFKACFTDELPAGAVVPVHQFGQELVVFRGEDGRARVLDAFCAHLGAHLGYGGRVEGTGIVCPFHAWRYDGDSGRCTGIPYARKIPARAEVRAWPTLERNGYVAVWHHVEGKPPAFDVPMVPEVSDPNYYFYKRRRWELDTHLQEVYENAVDVKHFNHVHGMDVQKVNWIPEGAHVTLELDIKRDAAVQTDEEAQTSFRSFMWGPGLSLTRVSGKMQGVSVQTLTPLDDEKVEICHSYYAHRSVSLSQAALEGFFDFYASDWELDFNLWNHKVFRPRPLLADGDGDIGRYRRWYKQFYSEDVKVDF